MKTDDRPTITVSIYGRPEQCRVLDVHPAGTIDVQRLSDGKCFRISGLRLKEPKR